MDTSKLASMMAIGAIAVSGAVVEMALPQAAQPDQQPGRSAQPERRDNQGGGRGQGEGARNSQPGRSRQAEPRDADAPRQDGVGRSNRDDVDRRQDDDRRRGGAADSRRGVDRRGAAIDDDDDGGVAGNGNGRNREGLQRIESRMQEANRELLEQLGRARQLPADRQMNALAEVIQGMLQEQGAIIEYLMQARQGMDDDEDEDTAVSDGEAFDEEGGRVVGDEDDGAVGGRNRDNRDRNNDADQRGRNRDRDNPPEPR